MADYLQNIIDELPGLVDDLHACQDLLLANAIMFGEIPSPTFGEKKRVRFMQDRLIEAGCQSVSTDELDNAVGIVPGSAGPDGPCILVSAHLDTPFNTSVDHTIRVVTNQLEGAGILDNSTGLAVVATLPFILQQLGISFQHNLILLGSSRSLGRGDIEGIRFFLEKNPLPVAAGVVVEGGSLGRLSYTSLGMMRGVINCSLPEDYNFFEFGASGTIPVLSQIISRILSIPLPKIPPTNILFGSMDAGTSFNTVAKDAQLRFEIRSEQSGMVSQTSETIHDICDEVAALSGMQVSFEKVAQRYNGGLDYGHPLVRATRRILGALDIKPMPVASTGELAALVEHKIPAVTLGLTEGSKRHQFNERIKIEPLFKGLAQLISTLKAIDEGVCDVEN